MAVSAVSRAYTDIEHEIKTFQLETNFFVQQRRFNSLRLNAEDLTRKLQAQAESTASHLHDIVTSFEPIRKRQQKSKVSKQKTRLLAQLTRKETVV